MVLDTVLDKTHQPHDTHVLTAEEYHKLVVEWNQTHAKFPQAPVHRLFEAQVNQNPQAIALVCGSEQLTYATLNERANQLARYIRQYTAQASLVGVYMERSAEAVVSFLAILKAGCAYVPIDPTYPAERRSFMIEDSGLTVLLTQGRLVKGLDLDANTLHLIQVDHEWDTISQQSGENLSETSTSDDLAYVIYTSGSTGRPKGVLIAHRALVNHNFSIIERFSLTASDRVLQFASLSFDVAGEEIYPTLLSGAALVVRPSSQVPSIIEFLRELEDAQITLLNLPTPYWHEWTYALNDAETPFPSALRLLVIGSERAAPERLAVWQAQTPKRIPLFNAYGLTETTITSLVYDVPYTPLNSSEVPVGRPLSNTQVYILDQNLQPTPINVAGELYIGGAGLANGYLNRPELTTEKFIDNPFTEGTKLYKTGDLMRYLADGSIEFLGRIDQQAKIRGYRIELGEIEGALAQHPSVQNTVVIVREDKAEHKYIAAYYVRKGGEVPTASSLRSFLKERLPEYMIPSAFVAIDAVPLTANGKVDRRNLPAPPQIHSVSEGSYAAPQTATQQQLIEMWRDILNVGRVGIHDDFFELGGHSLLAARLLSQIRKQFTVELPITAVFEARTVAALAEQIDTPDTATSSVQPIPRDQPLAQSFAQQRLWFLQEIEPESSPAFNIPQAFHFTGSLKVSVLEQCLNEIVRRHEVLRTKLVLDNGQPLQIIQPFKPSKLKVIDLSQRPDARKEADRLSLEEARRPFNLSEGSLIRTLLLKLDHQHHTLICNLHHAVSDGWSMDLLARELSVLYSAFVEGKPSPLSELSIQYADYAQWQRDRLQGETLQRQLAYWQEKLAGDTTIAELTPDYARQPIQTYQGVSRHFALPQNVADALVNLSQQEGATLFMTLLAALNALLMRYTGGEQITVRSDIANRTRSEVEDLIGFFTNGLVLRTDVSGNPTFRALLRRTREVALGAYAHQDLPFDQLIEAMRLVRDRSRTPLAQVLFVWEENPLPTLEFSGLTMSSELLDNGTAKFDLSLYMRNHGGRTTGYIEYNSQLFDYTTIERLLAHFQNLLAGIVNNPDETLFQLPLLGEQERQQMLYNWNETPMEYPQESCVHHLIEAQAAQTPDKIAVVFESEQLTYRELNLRANQVAHYLIARGVQPDTLIGICVERSINMLVGLLGILKAGCGYVPLDPEFPPDRLAYMLEDSSAPILLTQETLRDLLPPHNAEIICLDTDWQKIVDHAGADPANPDVAMSPANVAYVIYTSGSTGKPKGCQLEHRNVVNFLYTMKEQPGLNAQDVLLAVTTISFDIAALELYLPLVVGAKVVILSREITTNGAHLIDQIDQQQATVLQATPTTFRLMIETGWQGAQTLKILCGGEPLPPALVQQLVVKCAELWNMYGPTETTVWSTCHRISLDDAVISIGRPIGNTQIYILDPLMQPVPIGVAGELYIGGDGVARGYMNRPDLTKERFLVNPFVEHGRMYKTGDLSRYLPDGTIQFLGRADHQIKIRGFRIEPGEIEVAITKHPHVRQSVVIVREDTPGTPKLVAYLVLQDGTNVEKDYSWRTFLKDTLPEYMIPSAFVVLEQVPLTPNGKINRKALPVPIYEQGENNYIAPRNEVERILSEIWAEVLGLPRVSVQENFFELGGHSLIAARMFAQIEKRLGKRLPLATLFRTPTIETLATAFEPLEPKPRVVASVEAKKAVRFDSPVVEIQGKGSKPPFFCVGGGVINLRYLSQYLGDDQPFYALQSESLDGYQAIRSDIGEIADFFIKAIREQQPEGPYFIGGCYGSGMVALEMARRLQEQGHTVAFVGIFNTRPRYQAQRRALSKRIASRLFNQLTIKGLWDNITSIDLLHFQEAVQSTMWRYAVKFFQRINRPLPKIFRSGIYEEFLVRRVGRNYTPANPYKGDLTLFYTYDWYLPLMKNEKWGWSKFIAGDIRSSEVPGVPCDMFLPPNVQTLAEHFKAHITAAQDHSKA